MADTRDDLRYGFSLYPFAVVIAVGFLLTSTGPALFQTALSGMHGIPAFNLLMVAGIVGLQLLGAITVAAGFFGALHRILKDSRG